MTGGCGKCRLFRTSRCKLRYDKWGSDRGFTAKACDAFEAGGIQKYLEAIQKQERGND